jgi:hypothetical protein
MALYGTTNDPDIDMDVHEWPVPEQLAIYEEIRTIQVTIFQRADYVQTRGSAEGGVARSA